MPQQKSAKRAIPLQRRLKRPTFLLLRLSYFCSTITLMIARSELICDAGQELAALRNAFLCRMERN